MPELLVRADVAIAKSDYFLIAGQMKPEEIPIEVTEKLNAIYQLVCGKIT